MNLSPGTKLGPYEVLAPLGAGGMGEVWRARDTRLGRDVAVKVLAAHLSANPEIRARFEREARTVSALAHPNICVVHDVGREGDVDFLVMELVDGETLAARLARGPLPATDALTIGIQVADALDRAHRAGIVHRDLKPGNIMLTRAGAKLMDFGLARSTGMAAASGSGSMTALTQSPTMATPLTTEGSLIGTFQYMSPEQLEGREADARSDLWALGCVLYEMVAGRRPFEGRSQASLIGSIMSTDPPSLEQAAPLTSPALARTIRACLAKDAEQRIQTAHDVKLQLQWAAEGGSQAGVPAPVAARRRSRERLAWTVAAAAGVLAIGAGAFAALGLRPAAPKVVRFDLRVPVRLASSSWPRVSPDGRMVAFRGRDSTGATGLWVRPLDAFDAHPLDGTVPSNRPFWSPDSRYLAYIVDGKLRKVPVGGGPPVTICDAGGGSDGDWGSRDLIVFDGASGDSIRYVPAAGGEVRAASFIDRKGGEAYHAWPHFLPDGRHFLYVAYPASGTEGTIRVAEVGKPGSREVAHTSGRVEYAQGFLLYPREGTLMA